MLVKTNDDELKRWKERQAALEKNKEQKRKSDERKKLVRRAKVILAATTVLLWTGWYSQLTKLDERHNSNDLFDAAEQYDKQTHGTGRSAYVISDQQIQSYWDAKRQPFVQANRNKVANSWISLFYLVPLTVFVAWFFFSTQCKNLVRDFVEGSKR